jgi:hypothetical protein
MRERGVAAMYARCSESPCCVRVETSRAEREEEELTMN